MKILNTLSLVVIVLFATSHVQRVHRHRAQARPRSKPTEVERWEDEGGGLRRGGPGPGVKVEPTLQTNSDAPPSGVGLAG